MNKATLVEHLREEAGLLKSDAERIVDLSLAYIASIPEGESMELRGFGTFSRKVVAPTGKRNPHTGEPVVNTPFSTLRFKPSKLIRG